MLKGVINAFGKLGYIRSSLILAFLCTIIFGFSFTYADGLDYNVDVAQVLSVTIPSNTVVLSLNPNKTFASSDLNVTVATNNPTGYELTMSSTGTSLVRDASLDGKNATIETLTDQTGGYTESAFSNCTTANCINKWGYKKGTDNYTPYQSGATVSTSSAPTSANSTTLTFASKIDNNQPAGSYSLTLAFTAVANPLITCDTTITGNMQDFDPCPDIAIGTTGTLTDARDSKSYTVAKLADGNWWMTKNLNLAGGTKLYSETSDVPSGYPESGGTGYYTLPASETISSGTSLPSTAFSDNTKDYVFNTGNETTSQADCTSSSPCNSYYSWLAATAGGKNSSGTSVMTDGGRAAYSICPKGWKLPSVTTEGISINNNGYTGGDFYKMVTKYMGTGVTTLNQGYIDNTNPNPFNTNAGPGTTPNFLLAGFYNGGSFLDGSGGYYWSSSSKSSTVAYNLYFGSSRVDSASTSVRRVGSQVRCIFSGSSS